MEKILFMISAIVASLCAYGQDVQKPQLELQSFRQSKSEHGMATLSTLFIDGWPKDVNGDKDCAWVRVQLGNMPKQDAENVSFDFGRTGGIAKIINRWKEEEHEIWLFVTPTKNAIMEAMLDKYGKSNRLSGINLEPKHVYDVVLKNNQTMSISVITKPEGITATLENYGTATTPATFSGVTLGKQTLTLSQNGKTLKKDVIEVTENNVRFDYDLRQRKMMTFKSDPSDATLYIDGKEVGKTPYIAELPYDSYSVVAKLGPGETDSLAITVGELSADEIKLEPVKKKTFAVFASYGGRKVGADLYIDGKSEGFNSESYTLTRPIGKSYKMQMRYGGNSKTRKIKVTQDMDVNQEFKISASNSIVWPWQREYDPCPIGLSMGYVTKQWITTGDGENFKENVWGDQNKRLHGLQIGLHFQPCFSWGLGLYTGLFYEFYMSQNDEMKDNGYMDEFQEHSLYVPVHAYYRIPFARKVALSVHGGIGMDCGISASFSSTEYEDAGSVTDYYGEDMCPKRFNLSAEIGVGVRVGPVQIKGQYSRGLTNHKFYSQLGDYKTRQDKLSLSAAYVFGSHED